MANWLVLDDGLKPEWERMASERVSEVVGRKISVSLVLPTEDEARSAYLGNLDLYGQMIWRDESGRKYGVWERLPFHGVFILNSSGDRFAQAAVWNSYLEPLSEQEKRALEKLPDEKTRQNRVDDLNNRRLRTFPRQLLREFCRRIEQTKDDIFKGVYWDRTAIVPVKSWLLSRSALVQRVRPNNASDLISQICGVRRYVVSRDAAMGFSPEKRMNHPSYDGRICPVDTPESEMVGISLQLARGAWVDQEGAIHPTESVRVLDRISWGTSLIPFSHHNDGARNMMGAKNLRQATPVLGRERPAVRTGTENLLAEAMAPLMRAGVCPESTDGHGEIAMGRDLLVAYLPWNGWNLDDALVINREVVDQGVMSIRERKTFSRPVLPKFKLEEGGRHPLGKIACGEAVARFVDSRGKTFVVKYNDEAEAELTYLTIGADEAAPVVDGLVAQVLTYEIERTIPIGRGDKLMARHGNKGVIGKVELQEKMPRLPDDPRLPAAMRGRAIDILVNPHGVLSRMNPGQLLETHLGWLFKAAGVSEGAVLAGESKHVVGVPEVGGVNLDRVQDLLEATGLDRNGRIKLILPDGQETENPVVVGYEHFVRLHHIPELKSQARSGGEGAVYNAVTMQPAHGRTCGGGQRLGEMEVWALNAHGADYVLEEMLGGKSDRDWAAAWRKSKDGLPAGRNERGEDTLGFAHLFKDWLRALCIDLKSDKDRVRFGFLTDAKALIGEIGEAHEIVSRDACREVESGQFGCSAKGGTCGWTISGDYPLASDAKRGRRGQTLKFGVLLEKLGFKGTGALRAGSDASYALDLTQDGRPAGELEVKLENYHSDAQTLNLVVTPSKTNPPLAWKMNEDFQKVFLRAKPAAAKEERERFGLGDAKSLCAGFLLEEIQRSGSGRSVARDFSVVCPYHHLDMLHLQRVSDVVTASSESGLFDREIFREKDSWGYIQLPVEIAYPYWKTIKGEKRLQLLEDAKISVIPVLPLHYRKPGDRALLSIDTGDVSHYYLEILQTIYPPEDGQRLTGDRLTVKLQRQVADLFEFLSGKLDKKHGFLRHDGLGRRVDRSFRLVITPNPELDWDQAGVPTAVLWEMFGDQIADVSASRIENAEEDAACIERKAGWTWHNGIPIEDAYRRMVDYLARRPELVILLNRQPSLHRDSMQAFHPVAIPPEDGETLQLSPLCCEGFAADFDGDEMAGHYLVSEAAQTDARKLLPSRNVRSVATGLCLAHLDRDLVTGLELIHRQPQKYAERLRPIGLDDEAVSLLEDRTLEPGAFAKRLFAHGCERTPETVADKITALSRLAFEACTSEGVSFGFFDLLQAKVAPKKADEESGAWVVQEDPSPFAVMVNAEANGAKQIRQVVHGRGKLETGRNGPPVELGDVSLIRGMPWRAYFDAAQNARYSMSQKKIGTQKAGALTRQLVLGLWSWTIGEGACDCPEDVRSVAHCRLAELPGHEHQICARCFGTLPNGEEPRAGQPVGLIAAQVLGERGTQLSMRVFHAGSAEVDLETVARIMTGTECVEDAQAFVNALRRGAYDKIDHRYFELLWRALRASPNGKLSGDKSDLFTALVRGSQMKTILEYAQRGQSCSVHSPIARVLFNLFGNRASEGTK